MRYTNLLTYLLTYLLYSQCWCCYLCWQLTILNASRRYLHADNLAGKVLTLSFTTHSCSQLLQGRIKMLCLTWCIYFVCSCGGLHSWRPIGNQTGLMGPLGDQMGANWTTRKPEGANGATRKMWEGLMGPLGDQRGLITRRPEGANGATIRGG